MEYTLYPSNSTHVEWLKKTRVNISNAAQGRRNENEGDELNEFFHGINQNWKLQASKSVVNLKYSSRVFFFYCTQHCNFHSFNCLHMYMHFSKRNFRFCTLRLMRKMMKTNTHFEEEEGGGRSLHFSKNQYHQISLILRSLC